jgi:ribosomal protein S18 acetylase RimI-like enzyme
MSAIGPTTMTIDDALRARVEDAGINASAPRQQRWVDGWLVRLSPGKAKRARCIQAVAPGRLGIDEKLALCLPLFAAAGLPPYVRITPFSEPRGLDAHLAALGMARIDDTRVMAVASLDSFAGDGATRSSRAARVESVGAAEFAQWVGVARGSSVAERQAHAERIGQAAVPHHSVLLRDGHGEFVAGGQVVIEGAVAGLYDVFTAESERGRGHAEHVCRQLLGEAFTAGARVGYLQVDALNEPALRIYRRLGFVDAYSYHYRMPPANAA